jgi:hypothetical protein
VQQQNVCETLRDLLDVVSDHHDWCWCWSAGQGAEAGQQPFPATHVEPGTRFVEQ